MLTPKEVITKLKPCVYKYNQIKPLGDKVHFGFIAQDLIESFSSEYNFVTMDEQNEYHKVNYYEFIAPLVSVVQEQQKQIEALKKDIEELKLGK